jgi:EAL domain-containing protein (putative c-di-GMP-specific phosphodiesterase class I)
MIEDRELETIVRATIELAHNLKRSVMAEGVERQQVRDRRSSCRLRCGPRLSEERADADARTDALAR